MSNAYESDKFSYKYGDDGRVFWDKTSEKYFETGVKQAMLYDFVNNAYTNGVPWNGLVSISESPSGADESKFYADNEKYLSLRGNEDFGGSLECYTYPDAWMPHNGEAVFSYASGGSTLYIPGVVLCQQTRRMFGLCYRTEVGNDVDGQNHGYKLHLIYGCTASPSSRQYQTINDSPDAMTLSYDFSTDPVSVDAGGITKKTAVITIDTTQLTAAQKAAGGALEKLEIKLYGGSVSGSTDDCIPSLPLPGAIFTLFSTGSWPAT